MKTPIKPKHLNTERALILCYHGVTKEISQGIENYSGKHIKVELFEEQMDYIARHLNPISMQELLAGLKAGLFTPRSVVVTFDDGYENIYTTAWPILMKYKIPATIYLTTGYIENQSAYWVDLIENLINQYPQGLLSVQIKQEHFTYHIDSPQSRIQTLQNLKGKLKMYPISVAEETIKKVEEQIPSPLDWLTVPNFRIMNWQQIREMQEDALITIGSHTVNHNILSILPSSELKHEVGGARTALIDALGIQSDLFAYPNGQENDFTRDTLAYLAQAGFSSAVTTIPDFINIGDDPLRLNRYIVGMLGQEFPFASPSLIWAKFFGIYN